MKTTICGASKTNRSTSPNVSLLFVVDVIRVLAGVSGIHPAPILHMYFTQVVLHVRHSDMQAMRKERSIVILPELERNSLPGPAIL
jgi:hypothetical protein